MSINKETYREPLTDMVIDSSNLDKWKKKLNYVTRVNDNLLLNLDIKSFPKDVTRRKELYFEKIKLFIDQNKRIFNNIIFSSAIYIFCISNKVLLLCEFFNSCYAKTTPRGFEPLRAEPNGFRVHLLNHSDTLSVPMPHICISAKNACGFCVNFGSELQQLHCNEMDTLGIEPRASRMLSGCDTTTPCARCMAA